MSATSKQRQRCPDASVQILVHRIIWTSCHTSAQAKKHGKSTYEGLNSAFAGNSEIVLQ